MRIAAIRSLIKPSDVLADVGCDHGLVALYASGLCKKVIAVDLSEKAIASLAEKAKNLPNVTCRVSDGFDRIPEPVDQAVLSGMGGRLIIKLLSRYSRRPALVLGAQHDAYALREWLIENGYEIVADACVYDRGKYYDVIRAERGERQTLDETQKTIGAFYKRKNPDLRRFLEETREKILGYKRTSDNEKRLALVEEALKWQR